MKATFSKQWNKSVQPRKQRKYRENAPLHVKQKFVSVHLSADLRKKYNTRNAMLKKGDTVKILRGQFKKKTGKIEEISLKTSKVFVAGIEVVKKDGTKTRYPINASNLVITELNLDDKKRTKVLTRGKENVKAS